MWWCPVWVRSFVEGFVCGLGGAEVGDGGQQLADAADTYVVGAAEGLGLAHGCVLLFVRKGLIVDWAAAAGKGLMFR